MLYNPAWLVALIALCTAVVSLLTWAARWFFRLMRKTMRFLDDFFGEPAHDGIPSQPGVMARLTQLEATVMNINREVNPNKGSSLRDSVSRTERSVGELKGEVANLGRRVDENSRRIQRGPR